MSLNAATPTSSPRTARRQIAVDNEARNGSLESARRALSIVDSVSLSASANRPSRDAATERTASAMPCSAQFDASRREVGSHGRIADRRHRIAGNQARPVPRRASAPANHHVSDSRCDASSARRERLDRAVEIQYGQAVRPAAKCTTCVVSGSSTSPTSCLRLLDEHAVDDRDRATHTPPRRGWPRRVPANDARSIRRASARRPSTSNSGWRRRPLRVKSVRSASSRHSARRLRYAPAISTDAPAAHSA